MQVNMYANKININLKLTCQKVILVEYTFILKPTIINKNAQEI